MTPRATPTLGDITGALFKIIDLHTLVGTFVKLQVTRYYSNLLSIKKNCAGCIIPPFLEEHVMLEPYMLNQPVTIF